MNSLDKRLKMIIRKTQKKDLQTKRNTSKRINTISNFNSKNDNNDTIKRKNLNTFTPRLNLYERYVNIVTREDISPTVEKEQIQFAIFNAHDISKLSHLSLLDDSYLEKISTIGK